MCAHFKICTISVAEYHQSTLGDHGAGIELAVVMNDLTKKQTGRYKNIHLADENLTVGIAVEKIANLEEAKILRL